MVFCKFTNLEIKIMGFSFAKQCEKHLFQEKVGWLSQPFVPWPFLINFWEVIGGNKSLWNRIANLSMCIEVVESNFPLTMPNHPPFYLVLKICNEKG